MNKIKTFCKGLFVIVMLPIVGPFVLIWWIGHGWSDNTSDNTPGMGCPHTAALRGNKAD
jgi:hypothetical protein